MNSDPKNDFILGFIDNSKNVVTDNASGRENIFEEYSNSEANDYLLRNMETKFSYDQCLAHEVLQEVANSCVGLCMRLIYLHDNSSTANSQEVRKYYSLVSRIKDDVDHTHLTEEKKVRTLLDKYYKLSLKLREREESKTQR